MASTDMTLEDDLMKPRRPRGNRFGRQPRKILLLLMGCAAVFLFLHKLAGSSSPSSFLQLAPSSRSPVSGTFPKKIWQSWKVDPTRFEDRDAKRARTWTVKNPAYRYEVLTDDNAMSWVEEHYGPTGLDRPDIVNTFRALENIKIIQSDLLRYLIMYAVGGVYADIDVEALRSVEHFIPKRVDQLEIDMLIGVETDEPRLKDHPILGSKSQSFCQWTFMCKPRVPVMMKLIEHILDWLNTLARKQNVPISKVKLDFDEVLSGTGPSAFTNAILEYMSELTRTKVTWDNFHNLEESTVVGRVLVLPAEAMAAGTGHSDSGNHGGRAALVKHHFHASTWTDTHPRYKHPIYGEVESCNWNVDCVTLWDTNTAFFSSLPEEVQLKMIEIKKLDEAQKLKDSAVQVAKVGPAPNIDRPAGQPPTDPIALPEVPPDDKHRLATELSEIDPKPRGKVGQGKAGQEEPAQGRSSHDKADQDKQTQGKNVLNN
jgi:mannosyltransferase OCH1-like enzyme